MSTLWSFVSKGWQRIPAIIGAFALLCFCLTQKPVYAQVDMRAQQVAPGAWLVQGLSALGNTENQNFISNAGFVETQTSVVVVDALGSPALAEQLIALIGKLTPKPISHVLVTHYHADHIYGLQAFKKVGAKVIAHRKALDYLNSDTARLRLVASRMELAPWVDETTQLQHADVWLDGPTQLSIGGTVFDIRHVGPSHTAEDMIVYLPAKQLLFAGDVVFRGRIPYVGGADSRQWIKALDNLLSLPTKIIVPGHGPQSDLAIADMQLTRDYLVFLRQAMGQAASNLEPFESAYAATDWSRFEHLPLFKIANRMNAYNTYLLMESERP
jgi:glyoxylase-like metal-dependent hydrolase (beta-lactamase superfamily II)